jgi:serine/threonine protein kinase
MKLIRGRTLEDILSQRANPAEDRGRVLAIFGQVCQAIGYAHAHGVIHRDLKPSNVMVGNFAEVQVMDWGLAKTLTGGRPADPPAAEALETIGTEIRSLRDLNSATQAGSILGTPAFMPPEQAGGEPDKVGPACDVYGLGAILYRLLTGRPAYAAESTLHTLLQVIGPAMPPTVGSLRPEVPGTLDQLVMKCLSKAPGDRPASATALALAQEVSRLRDQPPAPRTDPAALAAIGSHQALAPQKKSAPSPPVVALVLVSTGRQIRLSKPLTTIGRSTDCEVTLKASDVSKQHCRIEVKPGAVVIEDLDSANSTLVNSEAVKRAALKNGDLLKVADYEFEVRVLKSGG